MRKKFMPNDDIIRFNTEDAVKTGIVTPQQAKVFKLVSEDHPILKEVLPEFNFDNPPVNPNEFASTLVETCKLHRGFGLSANQCGFKHRVFVMGAEENYVAFYNPRIVSYDGEVHLAEGCLSFPGLALNVERHSWVEAEFINEECKVVQMRFEGLTARCYQHELDHMNGIVYTVHMKPLALQMAIKKRSKLAEQRHKIQKMMINKVKEKFNVKRF